MASFPPQNVHFFNRFIPDRMHRSRIFFMVILFFSLTASQAQDDVEQNDNSNKIKKDKGFQIGLYAGSYFANNYSASLYDGYGFDSNGNKNSFKNSPVYKRIVAENSGLYGQADQIALALNVNSGEWTFDESDMPASLKYNPAFLVGLQMRLLLTKKDAVLFNVNSAKLNATGELTIGITNSTINPQAPGYKNFKTFPITGSEKRLFLDLGYQRILGKNDKLNFMIEGGASLSFTKFLQSQVIINNLTLDLTTYYNQTAYGAPPLKELTGSALGLFTGIGINISVGQKLTTQIIYSPSFEKINIGENPKFTLQNAIGFRAYSFL